MHMGAARRKHNGAQLCYDIVEFSLCEGPMELHERVYDIDDVWRFAHHPEKNGKHFELIDGALIEIVPPGGEHGEFALNIGSFVRAFVRENGLGRATVETGYHPPDNRHMLLSPDVAFISRERAPNPFPKQYVPVMPDLAVEILSPRDTIRQAREKAEHYLINGTRLVWIVSPDNESVEVLRLTEAGDIDSEVLGRDDVVSGEPVLPGFRLNVRQIFE